VENGRPIARTALGHGRCLFLITVSKGMLPAITAVGAAAALGESSEANLRFAPSHDGVSDR
jgi:hypothetical protein